MRQTPEEKAVSVSLPLLPLEGRGPALTSDGKNLYKGLLYKPVKTLTELKLTFSYLNTVYYCLSTANTGATRTLWFPGSYFPSTSISVFTLK